VVVMSVDGGGCGCFGLPGTGRVYPVKYFMLLRRGCLCTRTCWLLGVNEEFLNLKFFL
jgi:hypothetical protein